MVDLRSDTLTVPDRPMLETILSARLGDDGRLDEKGRGEDPTVNDLEDCGAALTGKEAGLLCCSGTMGNSAALLTHCGPGDEVLIDSLHHMYRSEKMAFSSRFGQLHAVFLDYDKQEMPDIDSMKRQMETHPIKLICVENTHNFRGGACTDPQRLKKIRDLADEYHVPVHMDGARLFNAAAYLKTSPEELCRYVDSVQFCFSKGLAAPVGSLLCGTETFIKKAKVTRKMLGGALRQGGIIAAPAKYAVLHNIKRLQEDNENAQLCRSLLNSLKLIIPQPSVQTNILMLDLSHWNGEPETFCHMAEKKGLLIKPVLDHCVRLVFYKGITKENAVSAARIIHDLDDELAGDMNHGH